MSGSNQYDKRTTTFNPDGRLLQVEYAIEHINQDAATIGILTKEGKFESRGTFIDYSEQKFSLKLGLSLCLE